MFNNQYPVPRAMLTLGTGNNDSKTTRRIEKLGFNLPTKITITCTHQGNKRKCQGHDLSPISLSDQFVLTSINE
jgi:hypothetical protein